MEIESIGTRPSKAICLNSFMMENVDVDFYEVKKDYQNLKAINTPHIIRSIYAVAYRKNDKGLLYGSGTYNFGFYLFKGKTIDEGKIIVQVGDNQFITTEDQIEEIIEEVKGKLHRIRELISQSGYDLKANSLVKPELARLSGEQDIGDIRERMDESLQVARDKIKDKDELLERIKNDEDIDKPVTDSKIWKEASYYRKECNNRVFEIKDNTLHFGSLTIDLNRDFNQVFTMSSGISNFASSWYNEGQVAHQVLKEIHKKYDDVGLNSKTVAEIDIDGEELKFIYEGDRDGIYFYDKRLRKNKFPKLVKAIIDRKEKSKDELKETLDVYNKTSGIRRKMMDVDEWEVDRKLEDDIEIDVCFSTKDGDNWTVEIGSKEYEANWDVLKETFTRGHHLQHYIKQPTLLSFLARVGSPNPVEDYKEILTLELI